MTKTHVSETVKELPGYPVQNSPSGNYFWGGPAGRGGIVYDIVWRRCPRRTPWMMLRTPVCSYPIIVTHLSFNFLCLLLLYSIYLNVWNGHGYRQSHWVRLTVTVCILLCVQWESALERWKPQWRFLDRWMVKTGFCQRQFRQTNEHQRYLNKMLNSELHGEVEFIQTI